MKKDGTGEGPGAMQQGFSGFLYRRQSCIRVLERPLFFESYYLKHLSKCGMINSDILDLEG